MPHILFLVSWYPHRNAPALGNFIREHARAAAVNNTVSVVYAVSEEGIEEGTNELTENHEGNLHEYIVYFGKTRSMLPVVAQLKKQNAYRTAIERGIAQAEKANGIPSLLHVHVIWPAAIAAMPYLKHRKIPLLITEHWSGYLPEDGNYSGKVMKHFTKQLTDSARHITVVSDRMKKAMLSHGLKNDYSILPNTVDAELFFPTHARREGKQLRLLHVSMLVDREKNISGMLRVMKKLEARPELSLEIVGDGPEKEKHEANASELGLLNKNVFFSGYKNTHGVADTMRNSDLLLMFSHFEGMPVTIIEAQCCGLPVIASAVGAIPEMVPAEAGILVSPGDEAALEKAILGYADRQQSFSAAAIREKAVNRYSKAAVAKELDRLYASILSQK